jgi:hypothetical protein
MYAQTNHIEIEHELPGHGFHDAHEGNVWQDDGPASSSINCSESSTLGHRWNHYAHPQSTTHTIITSHIIFTFYVLAGAKQWSNEIRAHQMRAPHPSEHHHVL